MGKQIPCRRFSNLTLKEIVEDFKREEEAGRSKKMDVKSVDEEEELELVEVVSIIQ